MGGIRTVKAEMHWALEQDWLQKVKAETSLLHLPSSILLLPIFPPPSLLPLFFQAEPEKNWKYPSTWGPYECLYCVSEGYRRFREKHTEAVPLQGLQANQMLAVRPNEQGELQVVTGLEPWSYSVEPGRGIEPRLARGGSRASRPGRTTCRPCPIGAS